MIDFPHLDPVALSVGPLAVRWYSLAYVVGFLAGWRYCLLLARRDNLPRILFDDFLSWAIFGVILGGRIGYVVFYQPAYYAHHLWEVFALWHGGMSFHGGLIGMIVSALIFSHRRGISFLKLMDILACATPIGLGLGRLANFVNGELYGRASNLPWSVIFPNGGNVPRHPSQIYEALSEGLLLFIILFFLSRIEKIRKREGWLAGIFLILYASFRFGIEFLREPDAQLGFLYANATMGQMLCVPMMVAGIFLILRGQGNHGRI